MFERETEFVCERVRVSERARERERHAFFSISLLRKAVAELSFAREGEKHKQNIGLAVFQLFYFVDNNDDFSPLSVIAK